jgi:hypothetical protein
VWKCATTQSVLWNAKLKGMIESITAPTPPIAHPAKPTYAVQPAGTDHYSLVGALFALVFAAGFLVVLAELATLAAAPARWPATSSRARAPVPPWARNDEVVLRRYSQVRPRPPLASPAQIAAAATLALISLGAFLPAVLDYADTSTRSHHFDHTAMFLLGCLLGLLLGSTRLLQEPDLPLPGTALAIALLAPAGMLIAMTPSAYSSLEHHTLPRLLYHLGMVGLGLITGIAASRLGRIPGLALIILAVSMGVMFAATAP